MNQSVAVKEIWQIDERTLGISWTDDRSQTYDVVSLRKSCPCAVCIDENTGKKILRDEDISDGVRPNKIQSVGRYALTIAFDDGHSTGIYTFDYLRSLGTKV
jgi:DUF971 family protein